MYQLITRTGMDKMTCQITCNVCLLLRRLYSTSGSRQGGKKVICPAVLGRRRKHTVAKRCRELMDRMYVYSSWLLCSVFGVY